MSWCESFWFFYIFSVVIFVAGLDINDHSDAIEVTEEQIKETWVIENTSPEIRGSLSYKLLPADRDYETYKKFFIVQINDTRALLKLNFSFNFEDAYTKDQKMRIESYDNRGASVGVLTLTVSIIDINDFRPVFLNLPATIILSEALCVGSKFFTVKGKDDDAGKSGTNKHNAITFSIVDGNVDGVFLMEDETQKSALLKLRHRMDYDVGPTMYNLTINATDYRKGVNEENALWSLSYLVVHITDVDDQSAVFTRNLYQVSLPEDSSTGTLVASVLAMDKDKTEIGKIKYGIVDASNPGDTFAINETSGEIRLVGTLNRNIRSFFALLVLANTTYHDPTYTQVLIVIKDANVNSPKFTSNLYSARVAENAEIGTLVLVVQANDADEGNNSVVGYSLGDVDSSSFYVITIGSLGFVYVNATLDYVEKNIYNFTVTATELYTQEKFFDTSVIVLQVFEVPENENSPVFNQSTRSVTVTENSLPARILQVSATDKDQGEFARIAYSIIDGSLGKFTIDNVTGWINTTSPLDREDKEEYRLSVRAIDGGEFTRHADVTVVVTVLDSNDHSPVFLANNYTGSVVENSNLDNIILAVQSRDFDEGINALFEYSIIGGDAKFSVVTEGDIGYIKVNGSLDYETRKAFRFLVVATETATTERRRSNASVLVTVIDANDNAPVFSPVSGYVATIFENKPNGTPVVNASATDADDHVYGEITFSLLTSSFPFRINPTTGEIVSDGILDYESRRGYNLTVQASDGGQPALISYAPVFVNVVDVNDNPPKFLQTNYVVNINENTNIGTAVLTVTAIDDDEGSNSKITYSMCGGDDLFKVDSNGVILVNGTLDYEVSTSLKLMVFAEESLTDEKFRANCSVEVILNDVNEYDPVFLEESYFATIYENEKAGATIAKVKASDQDGRFSSIKYFIISGNLDGYFTINQTSGLVRTNTSFDYESMNHHFFLIVQASDDGNPSRTSRTFLVINIKDRNDNFPVFLKSSYNATIPENLPPKTVVLTVKAVDHDVNTSNSDLRYFVLNSDAKFDVDSLTGQIFVNGSLDFEAQENYEFQVIAEESESSNKRQHRASVFISLSDVNEYDPVFNNSAYVVNVSEGSSAIGSPVVRVTAMDNDGYFNQLSYSILPALDHGSFSIDNSSGLVRTAFELDRERQEKLILIVEAKDNGIFQRKSQVTVVIDVIDSNDHIPVFTESSYNATIPEDLAIGSSILTVKAFDVDVGSNAYFQYRILGYEETFDVSIDGVISTKAVLDFENMTTYTFLVVANERNSSSQPNATVTVNIEDVNEYNPVFDQPHYSTNISENTPNGTFVLKVSANDADGYYHQISYSILFGDDSRFKINSTTGAIETKDELDREVRSSYTLIIRGQDDGPSPGRVAETIVVVNILDMNDHAPTLFQTHYSAYVFENAAVNSTILTVYASDLDKGQNGDFSYELVGCDGLFSIIKIGNIGEIFVDGVLDFEKNKTFQFHVVAKETLTSERRESNASVVVILMDVNDNAPVFAKDFYEVSVQESPRFPQSVGTATAHDKDSERFGEIIYSIFQGNENGNFTIDSKTGEVKTGAALNREMRDSYLLTIQAQDGGLPPRKAIYTMLVTVTDSNEEPPYFVDTPYTARIVENTEYVSSVIFKVNAIDPDLMSLTYSMENSSSFEVDSMSGVVSANGQFDRETQSIYNLTVIAVDQGGLNATALVIITVQDVNDNTPQFAHTHYKVSLSDNTSIGVNVLRIQATDLDAAHNGEIIYFLVDSEGKFVINQTTGAVSVSGLLDSQEKSLYVMKVLASDRGIPFARINSTTLTVNLTDDRNHAPKFLNVAWIASLYESLEPTFVVNVEARDPDSGVLGEISYSITSGNRYNAFTINATGAIYSAMKLDYENRTQRTFDLTVMARDRLGLADTTQVRITVVDVNDNPPAIINLPEPAVFNISGSTRKGSLIYVLEAEDLDSDDSGRFEFHGFAVPDNLTVDQSSGVIKAKTNLDSSHLSSILFTVYVKDKGNPSLTSFNYTIKFNIIVDPVADPFLLPTLTKASVFENASLNDVVVRVNSSQRADNFTILIQLPRAGFFRIDHQGNIYLTKILDHETIDGFSLLVMSTKHKEQAFGFVSVIVKDVNDESPTFQFSHYEVQLDENLPPATTVLFLHAIDGDVQDTISYFIHSGNTGNAFNVSTKGEIQIATPPDYEKAPFYNLTVIASDGVNTGATFVELNVLNVNDNVPRFLNSSYTLNLPEDTPGGSVVLQVSASDEDGDDVVYSISGDNGKFNIDPLTGVLTTTDDPVDFEETSFYVLNATASDRGGRKSSVKILINITDSNDNRPVFSKQTYNVTIAENFRGAISSLAIDATDLDSGKNGKVSFSIVDGRIGFSIDSNTGRINVTKAIDVDTSGVTTDLYCRGVLVFTIKASDDGKPQLFNIATVKVFVLDVNDNAPSFFRSSYDDVVSVLATGTILRVRASDDDCGSNGEIRYSLSTVNDSSIFVIDDKTGNINATKSLEGGEGIYFLEVRASNFVFPNFSSDVLVTITVIDSRNNPPSFVKDHYLFVVSEGAGIGTNIGMVHAFDVDQNESGVFIYTLEDRGNVLPFTIHPLSGNITLVRGLDREIQENFTFVVIAEDFGSPRLQRSATVHVIVDDVNDKIPNFEHDLQRFTVPENISVNSLVCTVNAVDLDEERSGEPTYIIHSGNDAGYFRIDNATGEIYLSKSLDRETINVYTLVVYAYNYGGNTSRKRRDLVRTFDALTVIIEVTDINDNSPEFHQKYHTAGFRISDLPGTNISKVTAFDSDYGDNAKLIYFFRNGNNLGAFNINARTGVIATTENITLLSHVTKLNLTVMARDSSLQHPRETAEPAMVTIYRLPESRILNLQLSKDLDESAIKELLQNITGPGVDIIIHKITPDGLLLNVRFYVVKDGEFLTQANLLSLILEYCEANKQHYRKLDANLACLCGRSSVLKGEDEIIVVEMMLLLMGVFVGIGGLLGIFLLCCLRRQRYMPVGDTSDCVLPQKAVSLDGKQQLSEEDNDPEPRSGDGELRIYYEETSLHSAEEAAAALSTFAVEIEKEEAIAKVHAYMNQALIDDESSDSFTDSSEDEETREAVMEPPGTNGDYTKPVVSNYTITNI